MQSTTEQGTRTKGVLRFVCTSDLSREVTGHGVGGDDSVVWDKRFPDQIKEAQDVFDKLVAKGYSAFLVNGSKLRTFDPDAEEIVMICPAIGG